jgi:hypothetical protein
MITDFKLRTTPKLDKQILSNLINSGYYNQVERFLNSIPEEKYRNDLVESLKGTKEAVLYDIMVKKNLIDLAKLYYS